MAEARVDLVLGNSQFLQGIAQADAAQKRFASSWEANVGRAFKRSPFQRAETALSDFAVQLGSGNLLGAVQGLAARFSGLGLAASVGVAVGIDALIKFRQNVAEAERATSALNSELGRPILGALGPEALTNQIESLGRAAAVSEEKNRFLRSFQKIFSGPLLSTPGAIDALAEKESADVQEKLTQLTRARSEAELQILESKSKGLTSDKLSASLLQNQLAAERGIAELRLRAFQEFLSPGKHNVSDIFQDTSRSIAAINRLRQAQDVAAQRGAFQESVRGFNPRSAAITEGFLREKIAADPFGPGVKQMQLQADQLQLFRQNSRLQELTDLEQNTIAYGPGARLFQQRNRQAIADQQQLVADQTQRVFNEQKDVSNNQGVIDAINIVAQKMDAYWK